MVTLIEKLSRCTRGATAIEYGLIASLIVIAIISGISFVGGSTYKRWSNVANQVTAVEP